MSDFDPINEFVKRLAQYECSRLELDIMTGCAGCGRRLLQYRMRKWEKCCDATIAHVMDSAKPPRVVCWECVQNSEIMLRVFAEL